MPHHEQQQHRHAPERQTAPSNQPPRPARVPHRRGTIHDHHRYTGRTRVVLCNWMVGDPLRVRDHRRARLANVMIAEMCEGADTGMSGALLRNVSPHDSRGLLYLCQGSVSIHHANALPTGSPRETDDTPLSRFDLVQLKSDASPKRSPRSSSERPLPRCEELAVVRSSSANRGNIDPRARLRTAHRGIDEFRRRPAVCDRRSELLVLNHRSDE